MPVKLMHIVKNLSLLFARRRPTYLPYQRGLPNSHARPDTAPVLAHTAPPPVKIQTSQTPQLHEIIRRQRPP